MTIAFEIEFSRLCASTRPAPLVSVARPRRLPDGEVQPFCQLDFDILEAQFFRTRPGNYQKVMGRLQFVSI
jgi:hypothetical protein